MNLGNNIYKLRKSHGLSQEQLAEKLNVSRQTIYKWENNVSIPKIENIMCIVDLFKISYNDLFSNDIPVSNIFFN